MKRLRMWLAFRILPDGLVLDKRPPECCPGHVTYTTLTGDVLTWDGNQIVTGNSHT